MSVYCGDETCVPVKSLPGRSDEQLVSLQAHWIDEMLRRGIMTAEQISEMARAANETCEEIGRVYESRHSTHQ